MTYETLHLKTERRVMNGNGKSNGNGSGNGREKRGFVNQNKGPTIPLATLYERISAKGETYLAGRMGHTKVLVFGTDERGDEGQRIFQLVLADGPYPPEGVAEQARDLESVTPPNSEKHEVAR